MWKIFFTVLSLVLMRDKVKVINQSMMGRHLRDG